jgi:hypothetical protein
MVYWRLRGFVCASWVVVRCWGMKVSCVVVVGESASALGDRGVCVEVVWFVSPASMHYIKSIRCVRMTYV